MFKIIYLFVILFSANLFACNESVSSKFFKDSLDFVRTCQKDKAQFLKAKINFEDICQYPLKDDYLGKKHKNFYDCIFNYQSHIYQRQSLYLKQRMNNWNNNLVTSKESLRDKIIERILKEECPMTREDLKGQYTMIVTIATKACQKFTDANYTECETSPLSFCKSIKTYLRNPDEVSF